MEDIKVIITDDHKIFADGLASILSAIPEFNVIGKANNGSELLLLMAVDVPHLVILDLNMPVMDGEQTILAISAQFPQVKILVLSMYFNDKLTNHLKQLGAHGYIPKDSDTDELVNAIKSIFDNKPYFKQTRTANTLPTDDQMDGFMRKHSLTKREIEILSLISKQFTSQEIADKLFISIKTVDTHRKNMIQKLEVKGAQGLMKFAIENNL